ncbi:MAG: polyprenyl synthetase family protein [Anaerolineae bacterium]
MTLTDILQPISDDMKVVEATLRDTAQVEYAPLAEMVEYIVSSGGKRIRPALVLFATRFHSVDFRKAVSLAAAVETLHTATLIHDDVVDHSSLRRGRPTINAFWTDGASVLAGDYVFARAAGYAAATGSVRVMGLFSKALETIVDGELRQLFRRRDGLPPRDDYYHRIFSKTASLFALATEASGVLMAASDTEIQALRDYGYNLGMAFQIADDVLDFVGEEHNLGKPIGSDLRQGTVTLPVYYFAEAHPEHPAIVGYWHEGDTAVEELVEAIRASSAIDNALAEASRFASRAAKALLVMPDIPARASLRDLASYVVRRQK